LKCAYFVRIKSGKDLNIFSPNLNKHT
jgi:hypothetical protein